ncbi:uncharacterized protein LOC131227159 [Magnolia sinica]|uniref:uncharacterized protein LOC131227159 n=1 Tax=Magnolia sinica TaxID=86752 RepID=UPI002658CCD8|nr:uncharacterized protein LOC131227159 [Magnolia sinica]
MGTCMSRCASSSQEECDIVQDKLVISQSPSLPTLPLSKDISNKHTAPCSPSPSSSSSFFTTSTPTTTTTTTTTSSITTTTSSSSCSISNEFSRGRVRDSACSSGIGLTKEKEKTSKPRKPLKFPTPPAKEEPSKVIVATPKQSIPRRCAHSQTPKKSRSSSPSLPRQRSSRNENERRSPASLPRRNLGSQSPCRRLKEDTLRNQNPREGNCKRGIASRGLSPSPSSGRRLNSGNTCGDLSRGPLKETSKRNALCRGHSPSPSQRFNADTRRDLLRNPSEKNRRHREGSTSYATIRAATTRKENARSKSPSSSRSRVYCLKKEESYKQHRNTECDECKQGEVVSKLEDSNSIVPMEEDRDNPFISLDCFIFL